MAREHGTRAKYVLDKCRCDECRGANTTYYHEAKRRSAPATVNAARARQHLKELRQAGVGKRAIHQASGVSLSSINKISKGAVTKIKPTTEAALLGVTNRAVADRGFVPIGPTLRHVEELLAKGWTKKGIARAIGKGSEISLQMPKDRIIARRARAIEALLDVPPPATYDRWGNEVKAKPVELGAAPAAPQVPVDVALPKLIEEGPTDWMRHGACKVNKAPTWVFFPGRGDSKVVAAAKAICATCRVADECLDYALRTSQKVGIWGGLSERERRDLRAKTQVLTCVRCTSKFPKSTNKTLCNACYDAHRKAKRKEYSRQAYLRENRQVAS